MLRHLLVQLRLGERRLVALVVPVAAVADQVDQEVEREALAVGPGQPRRLDARLGVVGVDVHDRHLEAAGQSAGVAGRERLVRIGGEPELVVGDEVDGAADVPAGEPRQVQRLGDDALAGERRVAVDEDAEHLAAVQPRRARGVDPGRRRAGHADQHRVDRLEVTRVGRHRDHQRRRHVGADQPRPGVVLHVAHPAQLDAAAPGEQRVLELGQDLRVRLLHHVREHVQPAAVGHGDEHVLDPRRGRVGDDLVEDRHHQVQPLDREAGLAGEGAVEEALEDLDLGDAIEQLAAFDRIQPADGSGAPRPTRAATPARRARRRARSRGRTWRSRSPAAARWPRRRCSHPAPPGRRRSSAGRRRSTSEVRPCAWGCSDGSPTGAWKPIGSSRAARCP